MKKDKGSRIPALQGVRGISIMCIVMSHIWYQIAPYEDYEFEIFYSLGRLGVVSFFMLSGFLFTIHNNELPTIGMRNALNKAWGKISSLYLLHFICFAAVVWLYMPYVLDQPAKYIVFAVFNLTLTQSFIPHVSIIESYNGPSWFLSAFWGVWFITYMIPKIVNNTRNMALGKLLMLLTSVFIIYVAYRWIVTFVPSLGLPVRDYIYMEYLEYYCPWICFLKFYIGILVGRIYSHIRYLSSTNRCCTVLLILLLFTYPLVPYMSFMLDIYDILIVTTVLLVVIDDRTTVAQVFSRRYLVWLGNISSEIFLIHIVVNFYVYYYLMHPSIVSMPWCFPITIFATLLLSIGWNHFVRKNKPASSRGQTL